MKKVYLVQAFMFFFHVLFNEANSQSSIPVNEHLEHIIMMDKTGYPCNPKTRQKITLEEYNTHIASLLKKIENRNDWKDSTKKEILIFIHGGLNSRRMGEEKANRIYEAIRKSSDQEPIFIVWSAGFASSYLQHLFKVRQGEYYKAWAIPTAPAILASDLLATAAYYPINLFSRPIVWGQKSEILNPKWNNIDKIYNQLSVDDPNIRFNLVGQRSKTDRKFLHKFGHSLVNISAIPVGNTITLGAISSLGMESWLNLSRRTKTMYRSAYLYDSKFRLYRQANDDKSYKRANLNEPNLYPQPSKLDDEIHRDRDGGVALFVDELIKVMDRDPALKITLVGHSMGAMIANEMLRLYQHELKGKVRNIVFMGAASSIHDWENAVLPYLQDNNSAHFYNLTLNPLAERNEHSTPLIAPSGSLLEWIDNYLSKSESFTDRRIGKYENFMLYLPLIPNDIRSRITLTVFDYKSNKKKSPKTHGSFDSFNFWEKRYWEDGTLGASYQN